MKQLNGVLVLCVAAPFLYGQAMPAVRIYAPAVAESNQMQQVSVSLLSTYPSTIGGELVLGFSTTIPPSGDPQVVFLNGTRSAFFTVAAGQTTARFSGGATSTLLLTGTTAGTIGLYVRNLQIGSQVLAPGTVASASISVPKAAPVVVTLQQGSLSCVTPQQRATILLPLIGFSNTRELIGARVKLRYSSGEVFSADVPLSSASSAWYFSAASDPYGGSFALTVPLTLNGELACASLDWTISLTNSIGSSPTPF